MPPHDLPASIPLTVLRRLALIAHGSRTADLLDWARGRRTALSAYELIAPGATRAAIATELARPVTRFVHEAGRDRRPADVVIFFWDPLEPHPGDAEVKALLHGAVLAHVPIACTRASADLLLASPPMRDAYVRRLPGFDERRWHPELAVATTR